MKIFVAGGTGVLGRRAVRELVRAGHDVTAVARSEEKAALLRELGAAPVVFDPFDATRSNDAVAGHDVVMNLATHIPAAAKSVLPGAWKENDRIRTELSRLLVDAAIANRALKHWDDGIEASDRAMKLAYGPRKLTFYTTRADLYAGKGDGESARRTIEEAIAYAKALPEGQRSNASIASLEKRLAGMKPAAGAP